jgi:hypothetical protein
VSGKEVAGDQSNACQSSDYKYQGHGATH